MRWFNPIMAVAALAAGTAAQADGDAICADRPGKATAACTVPVNTWQMESGIADWSLQRSSNGRETTLALGETVIKYGLSDRTDIGIDLTPYVRISSRGNGASGGASGFGDLSIQLKHRLTGEEAALQVAVLPVITAPIARHDLGAGVWQFGLLLPVGYTIAHSALSIALTPELDLLPDADGHGRHLAMAQVAGLGWQASSRLTLSAELWGMWDWNPAGTTRQASVDGSVAYLAGKKMQLDAGANLGLNRQTPDTEIYAGISIRF
jgi:hypothetical protein